jgi:branched-chain amino acid transport system permease protein
MASIYGSVVGAMLLTLLPQLLSSFAGWQTAVYGAILVIFMIALPRGIVPTLSARLTARVS